MQWLMRRVHPTWQLSAICFGVIAGVVLAKWVDVPLLIGLVVGALSSAIAFWKHRRAMLALAFFGGACLGLARGSIDTDQRMAYQTVIGKHVEVSGIVADDIDIAPQGTTRLKMGDVTIDGRNYPGQIWVSASNGQAARRSDMVTMSGLLQDGFGNFAASVVSAYINKIERPDPGDIALEIRDGFASNVRATVSEPGASLGVGFLLGQKSALPADLQDALKIAGLTHIVVASGYNLTILVRLGRRLFARISKYLAMFSSALLVVGFIAMTGLSPSMTRAGIVAGFSLWAWYYGRKFHPVTLLALAATLTVLWNPSYAWGDIGWLLSFSAFAGVMIVAPLMQAYFFGETKPPLIIQILFETVAATIATIPVIIMTFGQFSNIALLANLLILPFIPITMLFTALAGIGGMINIHWFGWIADHILATMVAIVRWCADIPWAQSEVSWKWWMAVLYIVIIAGACWYMKRRTRFNLYTANIVE